MEIASSSGYSCTLSESRVCLMSLSDDLGRVLEDVPGARTWTRPRLLRAGVISAVVVACALVAAYYPKTMRDLGRMADENSSLDFQDRRIAGGNAVIARQDVLVYAETMIPRTAAYRVVKGPNLSETTGLEFYVEDYFRYFLMPRRPSDDASWIVCYGCDRAQWGNRFHVLVDVGDGNAIGRLRH
jgi:hypothetical protein